VEQILEKKETDSSCPSGRTVARDTPPFLRRQYFRPPEGGRYKIENRRSKSSEKKKQIPRVGPPATAGRLTARISR
jgi:hypothetical protein